jgi:Ser/Thr protein kinase RdoA (MazF antagonist)
MSSDPQAHVANAQIEPSALVELLASEYDLAAPLACEFLRRGFNDHYAVTAGDERYVLRVYLNGKYYISSEWDFQFELDLLAFLRGRDLPVAYALPRRDGSLMGAINVPGGRRHLALFSFAEGQEAKRISPAQAVKLGEAVAALHQATSDYRSPYPRYHLNLEYLLERPMALIAPLLRARGCGDLDRYQRFADALAEQIRAFPTTGDQYGLIHGDLHKGNVFLDVRDRPTLFDFDHCGYGWRAYDLAVCKGSLADEAWEAFLGAYQALRPLSEAELQMIPIFRKIRPIWDKGDILAMNAAWGEAGLEDEYYAVITRMFEKLTADG